MGPRRQDEEQREQLGLEYSVRECGIRKYQSEVTSHFRKTPGRQNDVGSSVLHETMTVLT